MPAEEKQERVVTISPGMTVQEINMRWPECRPVFEAHGIAGCGGRFGPPERLDFFARVHEVNLSDLIRDLEEAIAKGLSAPPISELDQKHSPKEELASTLHQFFVKAAMILTLTSGTFLGALILSHIAIAGKFSFPFYTLTQAHGHVQLFGWVGLFIMGTGYHIFPRFKNKKFEHPTWALASLFLMFFGIIGRLIGQTAAALPVFALVAFASSFLEMAAIGIFAVLVLKTCGFKKLAPYDPYIMISVGYFLILGFVNISQSFQMMASGSGIVAQPSNDIFLHLILMGFVGLMILGVSLRILPHFLALNSKLQNSSGFILTLFNLGILLKVLGLAQGGQLTGFRWIGFAGSGFELIAGIWYVWALGIFERNRQPPPMAGFGSCFSRFVRLAYAWFCIALVMDFSGSLFWCLTGVVPAHIFIGAYRHAITVGFVTTMIMGVGYRVIPVFAGTVLANPRAESVSFYLILIGNVMRVAGQLATASFGRPAFLVIGISGYLEFTALSLFGWSLWKAMRREKLEENVVSESPGEFGEISVGTPIMKILKQYPSSRSILIQYGFTHLKEKQEVPGFVTIGMAARMHGIDSKEVIRALNEHIAKSNFLT